MECVIIPSLPLILNQPLSYQKDWLWSSLSTFSLAHGTWVLCVGWTVVRYLPIIELSSENIVQSRVYFVSFRKWDTAAHALCKRGSATPYANKKWVAQSNARASLVTVTRYRTCTHRCNVCTQYESVTHSHYNSPYFNNLHSFECFHLTYALR